MFYRVCCYRRCVTTTQSITNTWNQSLGRRWQKLMSQVSPYDPTEKQIATYDVMRACGTAHNRRNAAPFVQSAFQCPSPTPYHSSVPTGLKYTATSSARQSSTVTMDHGSHGSHGGSSHTEPMCNMNVRHLPSPAPPDKPTNSRALHP